MDLHLYAERLKDEVKDLTLVGFSADFANAVADLKRTPAAFILSLADRPGPNTLVGAVSQRVTARFGICLAVQNLRDSRGEAAQVDLKPLRDAVRNALLGWATGDCSPALFGGGRLLGLKDNVLWWQDDYLTDFYIRA